MRTDQATARANIAAARALVDELARAGVGEAVAAPGARSAPLVLALEEQSTITLRMVTDERAAAYFALGLAESLRRAVVLVSTSGTAAANFLPAVCEAALACVPLVVITADRPAELRDRGAAQTIDQVGVFGRHVRWSTDMIAPHAAVDLDRYYRAVACRALAAAEEIPAGPVHVNAPFREPLVGERRRHGWRESPVRPGQRLDAAPRTVVYQSAGLLAPGAADELVGLLHSRERGVIVCGPRTGGTDCAAAIVRMADALAWPVLADPLSGLRYGEHDRSGIVDAYDVLLRSEVFAGGHRPDVVVRFGALPTSKALQRFVSQPAPAAEHVLVADAGTWPDPLYAATRVVRASALGFAEALAAGLTPRSDDGWRSSWLDASRSVRASLDESLAALSETFAGRVAPEVISLLPDGTCMCVGNSMPVRELDIFSGASSSRVRLTANRGANGIDGVVSTALGIAAGHDGPTALLIGDLSFLHDLGGLQIAARHSLDLLVVVVNNDGGGIFSFLPAADHSEVFERLFATPHGLDLEPAVRMCGGHFSRVRAWPELCTAIECWRGGRGLHVVEVPSDRTRDLELHREIVARALECAVPAGDGTA